MTASSPSPATLTRCSAKGCRAEAAYGLLWNNPKLHTPERRKTWLACEDHVESLSQFLSMRGFLKDTVKVSELSEGSPSGDDGHPGDPG